MNVWLAPASRAALSISCIVGECLWWSVLYNLVSDCVSEGLCCLRC